MTLKPPHPGLLPRTNENFYELAWRARATAFFEKSVAAAGGNLCRALNLFLALDRAYSLGIEHLAPAESQKGSLPEGFRGFLLPKVTFEPVSPGRETRPSAILDRTKTVLENGKPHRTFDALDYHEATLNWLCEIARGGFDAVVELGAGYGRNLFGIYYRGGPVTRYIGAEYTASGRELMGKFHALDPAMSLEIVPFDHKAPDLSFLKGAKKVLLYTCHSIEQVERLPDDYFDVLAASAPAVTGLHFEPVGFQIERKSKISRQHAAFIKSQHYNMNLVDVLRAAEKRGTLAVRKMTPNVLNPQEENPLSVIAWDNGA